MSTYEELSSENESLRVRNEQLSRRARDSEQAVEAIARGEVDAIALESAATPVLLRAAQEDLRGSQRLLRAVFDGALEPMVLTDRQGRYVDANPAACSLYAVPLDRLIGRAFVEFAGPGAADEADDREFRERGYVRGEFTFERSDGTRRVEFSTVSNVALGLDLSVMRDITDRTAAEEALRRNEALFRAVIEKSAEVISLTAADGTTRYMTPSAWRLLGFTPEEMGSGSLRDHVVPEDRARIDAELSRLKQSGARDLSMEFRVRHRDGSILWIESSGTNLLDDPDVGAIVGNDRDITARKHAADALRESRDQLEAAQAIAHVGSWTSALDSDGEIQWSRECYRIFGIPDGTPMTVASFFAHVHPDDRQRLQRATQAAVENDIPTDVEHRVQRPDGQVRRVHERGIVERTAEGAPLRLIGTVQDITDRHAGMEALQASEERYRRIVENTSEGVWMYDAQAITTFMSARMASMLGYTVEEAVGQPVFAFMDDTELEAARIRMGRRVKGASEGGNFRLRRKDGSELWTSMQANPVFNADGVFEAGLVLVTDISSRRLADEARAHLAAIVESSEDAMLSQDLDGRIISWNAGAEKLYGYSATEMIGQIKLDTLSPEQREEFAVIIKRVESGEGVGRLESARTRKDGTSVDVAITVSAIKSAKGNIVGTSVITRDLTDRRQAEAALRHTEEQFRQAQKMEAVGRLAGGVAHDFNNLLSVILSYSQLAMDDLKVGDPLRNDIGEIQAASERATALTRQLLAFSRQQVLQPRAVDLNEIIADMRSMLGRLLGEDIEFTATVSVDLGRALADPGQLEQVVMNLAVNARDAMPDGGKLTIETSNVELDAAYADAHFGVSPGNYVMLAVSDTGTGMDAATRARIFEPFYTTKEKGKGTGLGLSTVFGIVEQSGGHVGVYSEPGQGCTFKVYLPRTDRAADPSISALEPELLRGSETILLVEDEDQVRAVACAILRRNGYHVMEASNGGEAALIAKHFTESIDLLLTDVVMPQMGGRRLAEELASQRPEMKVLFASGYTDDAIVHHGVLNAGVAFLQKPFTPDRLLRRVREVLVGEPRPLPQRPEERHEADHR